VTLEFDQQARFQPRTTAVAGWQQARPDKPDKLDKLNKLDKLDKRAKQVSRSRAIPPQEGEPPGFPRSSLQAVDR
jgi:hypothetical protein